MKSFLLSKLLPVSYFFISSLLFSTIAYSQVSQQWARTYDSLTHDNQSQQAMVADDLGNVYVTGSRYNTSSSYDMVTIKYSTSGTEEWVAHYDGFNGSDNASAIAIDKAGNLYVTGNSQGIGTLNDIVTIKYNNAGIQQWAARFNGPVNGADLAFTIKVDNNDNIYVVGSVTTIGYLRDYAIIKYSASGLQQWVRYHNGSSNGDDEAYRMVVDTTTSNIYITGRTGNDDITTVKYNSEGVEQWVRDYKGSNSVAKGIAIDGQGNIYVTGYNDRCGVTIKYDPSGSVQWTAYYCGSNIADPNAIVADGLGNVYITGRTDLSSINCFTLKYNSAGVQQWAHVYSNMPDAFDMGIAISLDNTGNIYVAALSANRNTFWGYVTIKYSPEGVQQWVERYDGFNSEEPIVAIAVNRFNDVFVTGFAYNYVDANRTSHSVTIKYSQSKPLLVTASPDTTINYGYGSNCVQLKAEVSGGVAPYSFTWSAGAFTPNNQSTTVCPTTSSVYTVIAKDAVGTADTAQVTIKVNDIRCGFQKDKILLCHNGNEICVAPYAVAAHLQHGDKFGKCSIDSSDCDKLKDPNNYKGRFPFIFKAYPNPFNCISTIVYQIPIDAQVTITLLDLNGREIQTLVKERKRAGYYVTFVNARKLTQGTYLCKMVISAPPCQSIHTLKLIVVK